MTRKKELTQAEKAYLASLETKISVPIPATEKIPRVTDEMLLFRQRSYGEKECAEINAFLDRGAFRIFWKEHRVKSIKPDREDQSQIILVCLTDDGRPFEVPVTNLARFDFFFL